MDTQDMRINPSGASEITPVPGESATHATGAPHDLVRARTTLGDFELIVCTDGTYRLDGGAMFGVVPKPLWEKRAPADDLNRILLGLNTVVVRTGRHTVVIETGIGNKQAPKMREIVQNQELLPLSLAAAGVRPEEVDVVINTHLHFDHCGWNTTLHPDGSITPTFPNARYFVHRGEVEHGRLQLDRDRVSYLAPNYEPLIESGRMSLVDAESLAADPAVVPGISLEVFSGHTAQMMAVHIESGDRHACYISDLIPTTRHLDPTWVMGYDLAPLETIANRKRFYAQAIPGQWLVLFTHDHETPMARIQLNEKGKPVASGLSTCNPHPKHPAHQPHPKNHCHFDWSRMVVSSCEAETPPYFAHQSRASPCPTTSPGPCGRHAEKPC